MRRSRTGNHMVVTPHESLEGRVSNERQLQRAMKQPFLIAHTSLPRRYQHALDALRDKGFVDYVTGDSDVRAERNALFYTPHALKLFSGTVQDILRRSAVNTYTVTLRTYSPTERTLKEAIIAPDQWVSSALFSVTAVAQKIHALAAIGILRTQKHGTTTQYAVEDLQRLGFLPEHYLPVTKPAPHRKKITTRARRRPSQQQDHASFPDAEQFLKAPELKHLRTAGITSDVGLHHFLEKAAAAHLFQLSIANAKTWIEDAELDYPLEASATLALISAKLHDASSVPEHSAFDFILHSRRNPGTTPEEELHDAHDLLYKVAYYYTRNGERRYLASSLNAELRTNPAYLFHVPGYLPIDEALLTTRALLMQRLNVRSLGNHHTRQILNELPRYNYTFGSSEPEPAITEGIYYREDHIRDATEAYYRTHLNGHTPLDPALEERLASINQIRNELHEAYAQSEEARIAAHRTKKRKAREDAAITAMLRDETA